jgi:hypothetical protein
MSFVPVFLLPVHIEEVEDATGGIGLMLLVGHRRSPPSERHGTQSDMFA